MAEPIPPATVKQRDHILRMLDRLPPRSVADLCQRYDIEHLDIRRASTLIDELHKRYGRPSRRR